MKHLFLCSLFIGVFFTITAMEPVKKKSQIWVKTQNKQLVNVNKPIAQQSNLLTVLQEKYKRTEKKPIPVPITKEELQFFCNSITQPAEKLLADLFDENYSYLMDITEKLKAPVFYAELMEQLLQVKELYNRFAVTCLDQALLKKAIYKKCLKKKCIITHNITNGYRNDTKILSITFSNNGNYFTQTISQRCRDYITNLWDANKFSLIDQFYNCRYVKFSPHDNFIILSSLSSLYFIEQKKRINLPDKLFINNNFPTISPDGRYIFRDSDLYSIDGNGSALPLSQDSEDKLKTIFHPSFPLIIFTQYNTSLSNITIHNLKNREKQYTQTYSAKKISNTHLCISTDGSLLLLNDNILLNIKDPYNPIIIDELEFCGYVQDNYRFEAFFIPQKNILFYQPHGLTFSLLDEYGKTITVYEGRTDKIITDNIGDYLALLSHNKTYDKSTITLWNLSHLPAKIPVLKINISSKIENITFTKDQLLLTQSYRTKLWDMDGDEVLDLGNSEHNAINPQTGSIITSQDLSVHAHSSYTESKCIPGPTKIYHYDINAQEAKSLIKTITESLTLSQALLLNAHSSHKKTLYSNLPDGRAFDSLPDEHMFLAPNLALRKTKYLPSQQAKHEEK